MTKQPTPYDRIVSDFGAGTAGGSPRSRVKEPSTISPAVLAVPYHTSCPQVGLKSVNQEVRRDSACRASPDDDGERPRRAVQGDSSHRRKIFPFFCYFSCAYNISHVVFFHLPLSLFLVSLSLFGRGATSPTHGRVKKEKTGLFSQWLSHLLVESLPESLVGYHSCRTFVVIECLNAVKKHASSTSHSFPFQRFGKQLPGKFTHFTVLVNRSRFVHPFSYICPLYLQILMRLFSKSSYKNEL